MLEGAGLGKSSVQTLGNLNLGWFNYWEHFSAEVQFSFFPFVGSLTDPSAFAGSKTRVVQSWFGYSVVDNDLFRVSPTIGFGSYNFRGVDGAPDVSNVSLNAGVGGEFFIPESRIMLGVRGGYQHTFSFPDGSSPTSVNNGGAFLQIRTGIRLF